MALQYCVKKSVLQCLEVQLWRTAIPFSCSQKTVLHLISPSLSLPQRRCYKKFFRQPIEVRPAKQDQGKMLLGDYLEKTSATVNKEVLREAKMISKLTSTQEKNHSTDYYKAADEDVHKEQFSMPNDESSGQNEKHFFRIPHHEGTEKLDNVPRSIGERRPLFHHPDPVISNAVKAIHSEHFSMAFGKYRVLLTQCATTKLRNESDLVLLEGPKLIREAFLSELEPIAFYQSRQKLLLDMMPLHMSLQEKIQRIHTFKTFKTPYKKLSTWSSVVKGQGLLGVFRLSEAASAPKLRLNKGHSYEVAPVTPVTIVLDGVKEPGNLGAIIRTVAAIGAHNVVLMKGCCDPWEGKALRAGCGAHFSLHITCNVSWDAVYGYVPAYPNVFVADVCNRDREPMRVSDGDEVHDEEEYDESRRDEQETPEAEQEIVDSQQEVQTIRVRNDEARRSRQEKRSRFHRKNALAMSDKRDELEDIDDKTGLAVTMDEEGKEILIDNSFNDEKHVNEFSDVELPTKYYNEHVYYPPNMRRSESASVVLVIGSETGLSNYAKKFVADNYGHQVSVPLHSGIDSLNTSVASGVILYELWNQAQKQRPAEKEPAAVEQ